MKFETEAALCAAFIEALPKEWTAYPETCGFDIVLVRDADGFQIAVEAKLKLNAKVICQAAESSHYFHVDGPNPDCRAVLVPEGVGMGFRDICSLLGVTVIKMFVPNDRHYRLGFYPDLPKVGHGWTESMWTELAPAKRLVLPDWIPDVTAGASAPSALTEWKVKAIKVAVSLKREGFVTRQHFAHFNISMSRWTQEKWIVRSSDGWIAGPYLPDFEAQHPVNYPQIEHDYEKWRRK